MDLVKLGKHIFEAGIWTLFGLLFFLLSYAIISKLAPFDLKKELTEDDNPAVGVMLAGIFVGIGIIIAAAIRG